MSIPCIQPLFKPTRILSPRISRQRTKLSHSILVSFGSFSFQLRFSENKTDIFSLNEPQLSTNLEQELSITFLNLYFNRSYHN